MQFGDRREATTVTTTSPLVFDPFSEDYYTDPYLTYRRMRDEAPVYYNEQYDFYALTRHDDVAATDCTDRRSTPDSGFRSQLGMTLKLLTAVRRHRLHKYFGRGVSAAARASRNGLRPITRQGRPVVDRRCNAVAVHTQKVQQPGESAGPFHDVTHGRAVEINDEVILRKTESGPGGSGVAEVALRCGRLLGMFARVSGVPWLLIEICAWSLGRLVTDASAGCSTGRCQQPERRTEQCGFTTRQGMGRHRCR